MKRDFFRFISLPSFVFFYFILLFSPYSRCLHFLEHGIMERGPSKKGVTGLRDCVGRFRFRVDLFNYAILIAIDVVLFYF